VLGAGDDDVYQLTQYDDDLRWSPPPSCSRGSSVECEPRAATPVADAAGDSAADQRPPAGTERRVALYFGAELLQLMRAVQRAPKATTLQGGMEDPTCPLQCGPQDVSRVPNSVTMAFRHCQFEKNRGQPLAYGACVREDVLPMVLVVLPHAAAVPLVHHLRLGDYIAAVAAVFSRHRLVLVLEGLSVGPKAVDEGRAHVDIGSVRPGYGGVPLSQETDVGGVSARRLNRAIAQACVACARLVHIACTKHFVETAAYIKLFAENMLTAPTKHANRAPFAVATTHKVETDFRRAYLLMLAQIPGVSERRAATVLSEFPTMSHLLTALQTAEGLQRLENIYCMDDRRKLGPALAATIHDYLCNPPPPLPKR
jgi:hypothetical protein